MSIENIVGEDVNITPDAEDAPDIPETQEEATQEATAEPSEPEQKSEKTVPLAALHESRALLRQAREEAARERQERDALMRRFEERVEALQRAGQPQPPSFEENPAEHLRHQIQQVGQSTQATQEQIRHWQEQQQAAQFEQQLTSRIVGDEQTFAAEKPDYYQAVNHVRAQRVTELQILGLDETEAAQQANRELKEAAFFHAHKGRSPAQVAYQLALAKGFKAGAQQPSAQEKFSTMQRGQAAAKTIGGGGAAKGELSAQALLAMSDDEFAEATKDGKWQKMMGG